MRAIAKRHLIRFSVRGLLAVVAVCALALAWVHSAQEQRDTMARVQRSNPSTTLLYDYQLSDDGWLAETPRPPGPAWLRNRVGVDYLARVAGADLFYATDADLAHIARLPRLRRLYLERSVDVTDAGLKHVAAHTELKFLVLDDADQITDAGLRTLGRIKSLAYLRLDVGRRMTPAGIEQLKRALPKCKVEIVSERDALALAR